MQSNILYIFYPGWTTICSNANYLSYSFACSWVFPYVIKWVIVRLICRTIIYLHGMGWKRLQRVNLHVFDSIKNHGMVITDKQFLTYTKIVCYHQSELKKMLWIHWMGFFKVHNMHLLNSLYLCLLNVYYTCILYSVLFCESHYYD